MLTKKKKIIIAAVAVCACICIGVVVAVLAIPTANSSGTNTGGLQEVVTEPEPTTEHLDTVPEGYIGIYTVDDFEYIRTNSEYNYILMNDIDFSGVTDWNKGNDVDVEGIFDGNNYTIYNFQSDKPLFYHCHGTIQNLNMENAEVNGVAILCEELWSSDEASSNATLMNCKISGNLNYEITKSDLPGIAETIEIGGLVAEVNGDSSDDNIYASSINGCTFNGNINIEYTFNDFFYYNEADLYIGGIVGHCHGGTNIANCSSTGQMTFNEINTNNSLDNLDIHLGGIAGRLIRATVSSCKNEMHITGDSPSIGAAGITAIASKTTIYECCNTGDIDLPTKISSYDHYIDAAGITVKNDYSTFIVSNCYNAGNITATDVGGISCSDGTLQYCYNAGQLNGSSRTGALMCEKGETIEYCYYLDSGIDVTGDGGKYPYARALSESEMTTQSAFEGFDFESIWTFSDGDYKYPALINQP